jgi:hypothetical protein
MTLSLLNDVTYIWYSVIIDFISNCHRPHSSLGTYQDRPTDGDKVQG